MCKAGRVGFDDVILDDIESEFSSRGWLMQQIWFSSLIKGLSVGRLEQRRAWHQFTKNKSTEKQQLRLLSTLMAHFGDRIQKIHMRYLFPE